MANFILYIPEKGLATGNGEVFAGLDHLDSTWNFPDDSLESADLGDLLCQVEKKETFYKLIQELWRCLKKDGIISMNMPHPNHDIFLSNPEFTRPILPETLEKFNAELNDKWKALGAPYPRLAHRLNVHFEITALQMNADPYWQDLLQKQQIGPDDLNLASKQALNVVSSMQITWVARKKNDGKKTAAEMSPELIAQFQQQIELHKKSGNHQAATMIEDMIRQAQGKK